MDENKIKQLIEKGRAALRSGYEEDPYPDYQTDQQLKKPQPPLVKEAMSDHIIDLPIDFEGIEVETDFLTIVNRRSSHRVYTQEKMNIRQLSYMLWCIQGVKTIRGKSYATLRTVPCGGARHPFEVYMTIKDVDGLEDGLYHYLPMHHQIEFLKKIDDMADFIGKSVAGQIWAAKANVVFYFSVVFYRGEWRYGIHACAGMRADAGHVMQNLYLSATALGLGGCALGAVNGKCCDEMFGLNGTDESIIYAMPVGTISEKDKQKEEDFYAFVKEEGL